MVSQEPLIAWLRCGIGRDRIFVEPKLYEPLGAAELIREQSREVFPTRSLSAAVQHLLGQQLLQPPVRLPGRDRRIWVTLVRVPRCNITPLRLSQLGHQQPRDNTAGAAARPLIADTKKGNRRGRKGPCMDGARGARRI